MARPEKIVVDTSAFYALISANDEFHKRAEAGYEVLKDRDVEFLTTSYALSETVALVHRRLGFDTLSRLLETIESHVRVFWVDSMVHSAAMESFKLAGGRGLSLVDWTVLLVSRIESAHVFTFDTRFSDHGVTTIPV